MSQSPLSPNRTPLGPARTLPLPTSRSTGTLAREFVDTHSTVYAHLYEHEDEAVRREKLEAEQRVLEEERMRGKEMRQRMSRALDKENSPGTGIGLGMPGGAKGRGSWRPLSLVAKRQQTGAGHARSASHQIPSTLLPSSTLRSVSHNPAHSSSLAREQTPPSSLQVVVESSRPNSPNLPRSTSDHTHETNEGDTSLSSEPKSTYSWATSFSGETAQLRATATYLRQSLEAPSAAPAEQNPAVGEEEEVLDTPEKVKRRRKRIVAIAHTVRQLEGVGSREAEDPNFYGELVKAWNDRPGYKPAPVPRDGLTDAPPALLPPPNLQAHTYSRYSDLSPLPPPAMSPAFDSHFGSPATPHLFTPAMGDYAGPSSATSGTFPPQEVYEYDDESDTSGDLRTRSFRYSYASALHDLALEGGDEGGGKGMTEKAWLKSPMRWSGAWEGWGSGPALMPKAKEEVETIDWSRHQQLAPGRGIPPSAPNFPLPTDNFYPPPLAAAATTPVADGTVTPASQQPGWGLGFMSAWWADRPPSSRTLADAAQPEPLPSAPEQDFQSGECDLARRNPPSLPTPGPSEEMGMGHSTPGHHTHDTSFTPTTTTDSGISTPSFGMRIHASAERRWARPTLVHAEQSQPHSQTATTSWLVSIPMETSSSGVSVDSVSVRPARPELATADSTSSNLTMTTRGGGDEREFPFSNHCRPPSYPTIPPLSSTASSVSVPSEIHALRAGRREEEEEEEEEWLAERPEGDARSLGGLASGSFPSTRTLRPLMLRHQAEGAARPQSLLERRHVRPLQLGELLNPVPSTHPPEPHIEPQSSIFLRGTSTTDLPLSLAPTPASIQMQFIPPPTTPVLPLTPSTPSNTSTEERLPTNFLRPDRPRNSYLPARNSDPSSSLCDSNGPDGDILPVPPAGRARAGTAGTAAGMLDLRGQPQRSLYTGHSHAMAEGGYRDATPSVLTAVQPKRRAVSSALLFWLGFVMPWCWFFGGWPLAGTKEGDAEKGDVEPEAEAEVKKGVVGRWLYHPDPWARRCRIAAVGLLPLVAIAGVVGVIVLGVMRGQ